MNRQLNPLLFDLPEWAATYRPHQIEAINDIMSAYRRANLVILDAPTGSGKTLIGETIGRMLQHRRLYTCSSLLLQDQIQRDYEYAKILKGRSNYPTVNRADEFPEVSAADCTWSLSDACFLCPEKQACAYERAKAAALKAKLAVINSSYFLTEANGPGRISKREFVVLDEADTVEDTLMRHVSVDISDRRLERFRWDPPSHIGDESSWLDWLQPTILDLRNRIARLPRVFERPSDAREALYLTNLYSKLLGVRDGIPSGNWLYAGRTGHTRASYRIGVSFKPARIDNLAKSYLWRHADKWLLMSATVISGQEIVESLGWTKDYSVIKVRNTFPVENRRVYYRGVASMSFKNRSPETWKKLANHVDRDLTLHMDHRVLIHTVSYELANFLKEHLTHGRPIIRYHNAQGRDGALREYLASENGVLLAPSMGRGVDLPGDACRVQMIVKVPYPNIKDPQIAKRRSTTGGQLWYSVRTIRELVQMCGRAIRSEDDWAKTYIYDTDFSTGLWNRNRNLFPEWFREAIVWR